MDKEFKELRDKIGKIWEAEEEFPLPDLPQPERDPEDPILTDTQIIISVNHKTYEPFKFFQNYGYFNNTLDEIADIIYFIEELVPYDNIFHPHIMVIDDDISDNVEYGDAIVIDLAKLDTILSIIKQQPSPVVDDEDYGDGDPYDDADEEFNVQEEYFPKFINDLKRVVDIIGGGKQFKKFYDEKIEKFWKTDVDEAWGNITEIPPERKNIIFGGQDQEQLLRILRLVDTDYNIKEVPHNDIFDKLFVATFFDDDDDTIDNTSSTDLDIHIPGWIEKIVDTNVDQPVIDLYILVSISEDDLDKAIEGIREYTNFYVVQPSSAGIEHDVHYVVAEDKEFLNNFLQAGLLAQ